MYDQPVRPESLGLIARGLAQDIFSHTGTSTTLVEGEYDYNAMTGLVIRDLELAMTAEFIRLRMASSAEARQREAEARDDEAREELEQFPDYVRNDPTDESQAQLLAMSRGDWGAWCNDCNCHHGIHGCDDLGCKHCYEEVETLDLASFTSLGEELHTPTGTSV